MNALKDLKIKGLKNLKINGFKFLKVNELKHLILKPGGRDDMEMGDLIKSKKEVEIEIQNLFKEKKDLESRIEKKELESRIEKEDLESRIGKNELESRIEKEEVEYQRGKLQKTKNKENEEIFEFPWREEIFPPLRRNMNHEVPSFLDVETDALQKEDAGISERIDSQTVIKVEDSDKPLESKEAGEILEGSITKIGIKEEANCAGGKEEANCASEKKDVKSSQEADLDNMRKKTGEITFPENTEKPETVEIDLKDNEKEEDKIPALKDNEKEEDKIPALKDNEKEEDKLHEKRKTENENPAPGIFGNSLIQELLESEDFCPEEEQNFMKYIEESSVLELVTDLRELKSLLAESRP